ncbi:hypothetical protein AYI69_g5289 [Smittium culicis]|uniref:Uncharacterized protein n=1 Tax=Smittium culicis TaxID=133412 RepID=A0A1R1Y722_9FUNG|nr:hypothetical protein AYI69_g10169 [Smittium culicis]OMJ22708.1 hypothetical protein AYI69_g5289 [Smittium culicis]
MLGLQQKFFFFFRVQPSPINIFVIKSKLLGLVFSVCSICVGISIIPGSLPPPSEPSLFSTSSIPVNDVATTKPLPTLSATSSLGFLDLFKLCACLMDFETSFSRNLVAKTANKCPTTSRCSIALFSSSFTSEK